ncbi:MAG: protein tyrosine phosphatase family protein [Acidobacteriota bacterium]
MPRSRSSTLGLTVLALLCALLLAMPTFAGSVGGQDHGKAPAAEAPETPEYGTIARLHTLDGVFLASQPQPADFERARTDGVKTVINLRHEDETDFDEPTVVEELGLGYVHLPFNGPDELTDEVFDQARELLRTTERPILLHCGSANRVGAVWLPYRVLDEGLSWDEALAEAKEVGLKTPAYEELAKDYVERHSR